MDAESIRAEFISRYGLIAFEQIAQIFAEVSGDVTKVNLMESAEWIEFATDTTCIPSSESLRQAFLWCARHRQALVSIRRPVVPDALHRLEDPKILKSLIIKFPFFLASSVNGYRCENCFDQASATASDILSQKIAVTPRRKLDKQ